jgi:hypothetical protein
MGNLCASTNFGFDYAAMDACYKMLSEAPLVTRNFNFKNMMLDKGENDEAVAVPQAY